MEQSILIAIGPHTCGLYGVRFVASFFLDKRDVRCSLLCLVTDPASWLDPDPYQGETEEIERQRLAGQGRAGQVLDTARALLTDSDFPEDNVSATLRLSRFGTAQDIVQEAARGMHDAVVLGRRALGRLEEILHNSVSLRLLNQAVETPMWFCRSPEMGRRNVLLCVDDTVQSLRAADHVGFMVARQPEHGVTLFHVRRRGRDAPDHALERARRELARNGMDQGRVDTVIVEGQDAASAILAQAEQGRYAAVATGRAGESDKGAMGLFLGSVSTRLLRGLTGACLWVSR